MSLGEFKQNQKGMTVHGTHHLLVYTHAINILGGSTEALAVSSNEIGLEVNAKKMKYMFMS